MKARVLQYQINAVLAVENDEGKVCEVTQGSANIMEADFGKTLNDISKNMVADWEKENKQAPKPAKKKKRTNKK